MVSPAPRESDGVVCGNRLVWYVAVVFVGFGLLYLLTRSSVPVGDSKGFIAVARGGDPSQIHYGEPIHFLQVPLARAVWRILDALGASVSLETIFVGFSLVGTLAAIVFVGLIAAKILRTQTAAWLAAVLFGTSLHASTQWNGELYGLALGFVTAGLFFTLRGRVAIPAFLWGLSVLSHSDFAMAAPTFIAAVSMAEPSVVRTGEKLRRASVLLGLAATSTVLVMLLGSWTLGKWFDSASFAAWLGPSYEARQQDVSASPEVFRAMKGLVTAYTVAGHYWRDILTGRGQYSAPLFVPAAAVGLLVLVLTSVLLVAAAWRRSLFLFALVWLLPFHILVNWWFVPTVEKYHAGALPGFVLLVTGGLVFVGTRMPARRRCLLYGGYVAAFAGLNLFGAVLPMQALGRNAAKAAREIRQLHTERGGRAVFVACDDPKAIVGAQVTFLRLRSIWKGTLPEIQQAVVSWIQARRREGNEPYLVGRWCLPEEWKTTWSKEPFDLYFLELSFQMVPTRITGIPISESVPTNPFNWTQGDVVGLEPRSDRHD
ncbi:MAG: hypothetical protein EXQ55_03050 [Acidobacteria bacterium]|nr:hypothetical protein [Acidobacteriota bacterium]